MFSPGIILLCALTHSIGWGVRGNWGHEYGAMIPGALSAIAAALGSNREDWRQRVLHFSFFSAMGWSFGGSMSYGLVQGYTHTASTPDVYYGFAMLFVIGFLWGALGGAGAALPAILDRKMLTDFYPPLLTIFSAWFAFEYVLRVQTADWYDTDWAGVLVLLVAHTGYMAVRRRMTDADRLIFSMGVGWYVGFLTLVVVCGLRMTPPRGDNWAGCLGMFIAMMLYFRRHNLQSLVWISLLSGLFSGIGFSTGQLIRVWGFAGPYPINWHSVLEQTFGFISGVGIAIGFAYLARRTPRPHSDPSEKPWTEPFAFCFLLLVVTYVNIVKNIHTMWLPQKQVPEEILGLGILWWFRLAYILLAVTLIAMAHRHRKQPLAVVPSSWLGRGQALFLLFLWWIVVGNLSRYLPFQPGRLVTEGVIFLNACLASWLVLAIPKEADTPPQLDFLPSLRRLAFLSLALALLYPTLAMLTVKQPVSGASYRFRSR